MVCKKCEKKLKAVICPDPWKAGSKNSKAGDKGRKVNQNKLLGMARLKKVAPKKKFQAFNKKKCKICKQQLHQPGYYCQACAYNKGICSMCGKKILDTTFYKQRST
mmetsp:Transcript_16555/g.29720  ORF Transcript_16555/g.29720 Transcript_16555/m.29720 type:complete len:106 (-) Transcript_16555:211-528(-)|eukprot:CAMPEP_0197524888 /NCGR_PEP_ID=MMETSP1318-20131121/10285_1 /TAXON_ID=552666 /ORGANISM="Partenskyella glossopodia, Strain RCC365" /LENGTH=105 /DNA_ID=CAMNT_0043077985 /DNA_START=173 /DNA_END=490 /DNA_ORIENTATION=+